MAHLLARVLLSYANFGTRLPNFSWQISVNVYRTIHCQKFQKPNFVSLFFRCKDKK
jgi:hypothetical protein